MGAVAMMEPVTAARLDPSVDDIYETISVEDERRQAGSTKEAFTLRLPIMSPRHGPRR
jgi:hypothetical protein